MSLRSRRKHSHIDSFETDRNMFVNFDSYTDEWNRQLRIINKDNQRQVYRVRNSEYDLVMNPKSFEEITRRHNRRIHNADNYHRYSDLFLDNIKYQIFAETQRIIGGSNKISGAELPELDEAHKTGYAYEDNIISIAADKDPRLLKVIEGDNDLLIRKDPSKRTDHEAIDKALHSKKPAVSEEALSNNDKKKINDYSNYSQPSKDKGINDLKDDIVDFSKSKDKSSLSELQKESAKNSPYETTLKDKPVSPAEKDIIEFGKTPPPPPIPTKSLVDENGPRYSFNIESSNNLVRPSQKPIAPIVSNEERIKNLKEIEDTNWEKIKSYVRDFNTSDQTIAIGNTSSIVDADNALKVDLKAKFYLSQAELKEIRDKQAENFKNVIEEYEETLKKHEEKALQQLYDYSVKIPEIGISKEKADEIVSKKQKQNEANLKVINENVQLKKQIEELEKQLKKPMETPKVDPILPKFEMEKMVIEVEPSAKAKEIEEQEVAKSQEDNNVQEVQQQPAAPKQVAKLRLVDGKVVKEYITIDNREPQQKELNNIQQPARTSFDRANSTLPQQKGFNIDKILSRSRESAGVASNYRQSFANETRETERLSLNDYRNPDANRNQNSGERIFSIKEAYGKK